MYKYPLPSGVVVEVETADELLELDRKVRSGDSAPTTPFPPPTSFKIESPRASSPGAFPGSSPGASIAWREFVALMYGPQRKLLEYVLGRNGERVTLGEMATHLGVETTQVAGGSVSGVRKNARKAGLNPDDVLTRLRDGSYVAGELLVSNGLPPRSRYDKLLEDDFEPEEAP